MKTYRILDLFAGCGGLTKGFVDTGRFTPVGAVERDFAAAATYAENFGGDHMYLGDIRDWFVFPLADVVIGGPPCQGFSNLNRWATADPRNGLWQEYLRVLDVVRPQVFVLENVGRFLLSEQYLELKARIRGDYQLRSAIVRATDFGAAQLRRRAIVIGTRVDLEPIDLPQPDVPQWNVVSQALEGIPQEIDPSHTDFPDAWTEHFDIEIQGPFRGPDLHVTRRYDRLSVERFLAIPTGGNRFDLPEHLKAPCWSRASTGAGDVMGRMRWDTPSVTIRTEFFKPEKGRFLHPQQHRAISHWEAARLQGFDDTFAWCGSKTEVARQIGNAVPVPLARGIAEHVARELDRQKPPGVRAPGGFAVPP